MKIQVVGSGQFELVEYKEFEYMSSQNARRFASLAMQLPATTFNALWREVAKLVYQSIKDYQDIVDEDFIEGHLRHAIRMMSDYNRQRENIITHAIELLNGEFDIQKNDWQYYNERAVTYLTSPLVIANDIERFLTDNEVPPDFYFVRLHHQTIVITFFYQGV